MRWDQRVATHEELRVPKVAAGHLHHDSQAARALQDRGQIQAQTHATVGGRIRVARLQQAKGKEKRGAMREPRGNPRMERENQPERREKNGEKVTRGNRGKKEKRKTNKQTRSTTKKGNIRRWPNSRDTRK